MKLITCVALALVIMEGSYCVPTYSERDRREEVQTTSSSWGYDYSLSDNRGFAVKHDDKSFQLFPFNNNNNTGFKKQYTERTVQDHYTSKDGQPTSHTYSINEYTRTSKPLTTAKGQATPNPNGTSPGRTASSPTIASPNSPPNGFVDPNGSASPARPDNKVTSPRSEPGTPPNTVPSKPISVASAGYPLHGSTNTSPRGEPVGTLSGTPIGTFSTSYGYYAPQYPTYIPGPQTYNSPSLPNNPMYSVPPNNQMYTSISGYSMPTSSMYGSVPSPYWPQNRQMFGPENSQTFKVVRIPMYGEPQRTQYSIKFQ